MLGIIVTFKKKTVVIRQEIVETDQTQGREDGCEGSVRGKIYWQKVVRAPLP